MVDSADLARGYSRSLLELSVFHAHELGKNPEAGSKMSRKHDLKITKNHVQRPVGGTSDGRRTITARSILF